MFYHIIINTSIVCFVTFILILWFESDIVQTFGKLTNTRNLLKLPDFEKYKLEEDIMSNYANFLYTKYPGYLTKLLSCPICLCFWTNLVIITTYILYTGYPINYICILLPINYIISLILYLIIRKLL